LATSSQTSYWDTLAEEAARESRLWDEALLPREQRQLLPVFSPLGDERFALGLETIYEGYLLHYGRPRLFAPRDADTALLLGDYLYANGLVRIAVTDDVGAVGDLAELISLCAELRAEKRPGDGAVWAATAARLGVGGLAAAREALRAHRDPEPLVELARTRAGAAAVERALAAHERHLG
jgi:hypothetical protein